MTTTDAEDRALGALTGLAVGDALGMPTQLLDRATIVARYGLVLTGFASGPEDHPIAARMPAGSVTDDTEQALVLARVLLDGDGHVDPGELARRLVAWEEDMRARGSLDLLGPSTRRALTDLLAGVPVELTGRSGDTNGAAMRITPVGIATPPDVDALVAAVVEANLVTHHTSLAHAGAGAVAAAVSAGIDGADAAGTLELALATARAAARHGRWVAGADVATRIAWATSLVRGRADTDVLELVGTLVGTSLATQESVPAAFALVASRPDDPWAAVRLAASVGGDCDTIAAMAGAMVGARYGVEAFPEPVRARLEEVNHLRLGALVPGLLALRSRPRAARRAERPGPGAAGGAVPRTTPATPPDGARVLLVGQAVVDLVLTVPHLPEHGGDVLAGPATPTPGGGVNTLLAAARQGARVTYAGMHGTGPHGDLVRAALRREGVELAQPASVASDTGTVVVLVDAGGERTFVTSPGAESGLAPADLAPVHAGPDDVVCVSGYALAHTANRAALLAWLPTLPGTTTVLLDPGPLVGVLPPAALAAVLSRADWCSANEQEAATMTGCDDPHSALQALAARTRPPGSSAGARPGGVVVRLGAQGCLLRTADGQVVAVPAPPVEVVDLTGAGDAHTGVLAASLAAGLPPLVAVQRATVAASLAVTRPGPATCPTAAQIDATLAEHPPVPPVPGG
ncbi:PfkB family carbohydrate kinase [Cellulomonas soli]|uniref:PfkB family carbohydrate kinase n=1 Tax=Cellulomonas soli TaxID=931535 RepID=UPI003F8401C2